MSAYSQDIVRIYQLNAQGYKGIQCDKENKKNLIPGAGERMADFFDFVICVRTKEVFLLAISKFLDESSLYPKY